MKKVLTQLKEGAKNLLTKILRHESAVYTAAIALVMSLVFFYTNEIKHSSEILKTEKEKAILILELNQSKFMHEETGKAFDFQMGIIKKQSDFELKLDPCQCLYRNLSLSETCPEYSRKNKLTSANLKVFLKKLYPSLPFPAFIKFKLLHAFISIWRRVS